MMLKGVLPVKDMTFKMLTNVPFNSQFRRTFLVYVFYL